LGFGTGGELIMQKYARIKNKVVIEIITIDEINIKSIEDLYPQDFIKECIPISSVTSVSPNWIYIDDQFKPPKPDDLYEWSNAENSWILDKKYINPGDEYIWSNLKKDWIKVILTPEEFFNKFQDHEILKWKTIIREGNVEAALIEDKLRIISKFDLRTEKVKNLLHKLTTPALGNVLSINRLNDFIIAV
jgi:hypothetical protein